MGMKVVITGASKGIGKAVAEHFAQKGADLFLCSRQMDRTLAWQNELMRRYNCSVSRPPTPASAGCSSGLIRQDGTAPLRPSSCFG